MNTKELTREDLIIGHTYSAKRQTAGRFYPKLINDRQIQHIGYDYNGEYVQYDSPAVKPGANYPKIPVEKFLKWAKEDISAKMPKGEWREAEN